jgi:hypothetical protein
VPKLYIVLALTLMGLSLFMFNAGAQFIVYVVDRPPSPPPPTSLPPSPPPHSQSSSPASRPHSPNIPSLYDLCPPPLLKPPSVSISLLIHSHPPPTTHSNVVGFVFPAYASFRALEAGDQAEGKIW